MDQVYWLARLAALQRRLEEHLDAHVAEHGERSPEFLAGYRAGRTVALERAILLVGQARREMATETARTRR
jgi:hypothetical protein